MLVIRVKGVIPYDLFNEWGSDILTYMTYSEITE